jgi:hypothetical protein
MEHPVGAAALRPPLAALPLTAAAYPLRVLGGPPPAIAILPMARSLQPWPFLNLPLPDIGRRTSKKFFLFSKNLLTFFIDSLL